MSRPKFNRRRFKIAVFHNLRGGGAKRALIEITKRLSKKNVVDVYSLDIGTKKEFNFVNKIEIFNFNISRKFLFDQEKIIFRLPKVHKKIAKRIDYRKYDIVYVNHDIFTKSPYILRFLRTNSVYICHEAPREFYEDASLFSTKLKYRIVNLLRLPIKYIDRDNVGHADLVLTNSLYSQKTLEKIYKREIKRLTLGVDGNFFKWQKKKRENFFLNVSALAKFKGHEFIIKSLALLPEEERFPYYVVANGGRDEHFIRSLAKKKKVKLIIKRGLGDDELVDLYNKARALLVGAYNEPFGLVALEAMACGCPIVGVAEGGLSEAVSKELQGFLVARDKKNFARAISKALKTKFNERKIRDYVIRKWPWEKTVKQLEIRFRKLCKKKLL